MKIAVIGQGYVGLPLAKAAANAGHTVIGFDNNEAVIKQLLLSEVSTANYTPTLDPKTITGCDIYIIAVPSSRKFGWNLPTCIYNIIDRNFINFVFKK